MNGIQKYLIATALDAASEAAGRLIASNRLNPVMVAQSLEELAKAVKSLDETIVSAVPCELEYKGSQVARQQSLASALIEPVFFQPSHNR